MYRHKTDYVSLVFGLVLAGAATLTTLDTDIPWTTGRWIGPIVLVLIGVVLLVPASRRLANRPDGTRGGVEVAESPLSPAALAEAEAELPPRLTD